MFKQFKLFDRSGNAKSGSSLGAIGVNSVLGPSAKQYKSLIFNSGSSQYLSRTPLAAGNRKTWTWSGWVKRNKTGQNDVLFDASNNASTTLYVIRMTPANDLEIGGYVSSYNYQIVTTQLFRDLSAWYHIVVAFDTTEATASNRVKLYVNGSQVTSFAASSYPTLNFDGLINNNIQHRIGSAQFASQLFDGYLTEINFIDGQALGPENFGYFDSIGIWQPKRFAGAYGTNGFYLPLNDSSFSELVKDKSGNGNNWALNGYSSSLVSDVVVSDSPVNNFCTLNTLDKGGSINVSTTPTNGNLTIASNTTGFGSIRGTMAISSGKWYWEFTCTADYNELGICTSSTDITTYTAASSTGYVYVSTSGNKANNGTFATYAATFVTGDVIGVAFDADTGVIYFSKNNMWANGSGSSNQPFSSATAAYTGLTSGPYFPVHSDDWNAQAVGGSYNFGQKPFRFSPPSGYKSLCTANLPVPTITNGRTAMDVVTYTGNGSARSITGLGFSPDLVWIKGRSGATDHAIYDSVRGVQLDLGSNLTSAETTQSQGLTAFNSNGFNIGTLAKLNTNSATYVAWAWDEAAIDGLDIVSFTGTGATQNISHSLGVTPKMVIYKCRNTAVTSWVVGHSLVNGGSSPWNYYMVLNATDAQALSSAAWNNTAPTSTQFTVGGAFTPNTFTYIAYLFAEVEGFSKFGSYTGNGSADGPFVWCGFRPRWILTKNSSGAADWILCDTARDGFNLTSDTLAPNTSGSTLSLGVFDILSNGFKLRYASGGVNNSGAIHIFAAFAEHPFKYARAR